MSAAVKLLDRLDRPKQTRPGSWVAGCPCCHSKRGRPISIREADSGAVLLFPFCGCSTSDVLSALGLTLADLFDRPLGHQLASSVARISARDILDCVSHEMSVAVLIAEKIIREGAVAPEALKRLTQAASRIGTAKDYVYGR